jgi:hypothetical protein
MSPQIGTPESWYRPIASDGVILTSADGTPNGCDRFTNTRTPWTGIPDVLSVTTPDNVKFGYASAAGTVGAVGVAGGAELAQPTIAREARTVGQRAE